MKHTPLLSATALLSSVAVAGGPVAPKGWNGSHEPTYTHGQECCLPADLNGTGLVGGAFVLLSDSKMSFAVYALTYTPMQKGEKEVWHLLETHPAKELPQFTISIEEAALGLHPAIKVCKRQERCNLYSLRKNARTFTKTRSSSS